MVRTPTYRLHKATGMAVVTLGGKDHYLGKHNSPESKKLYKRLLAEYLAADGVVRPSQNDNFTVSELMAAFLKFSKRHFGGGDNTQFAHYGRLAKLMKRMYGATPAKEFGSLQFKAVRHELVNSGKARTYVNEVMKRLIRVFRWGAGEELIPSSVGHVLRDIEPLRRGRTSAKETGPIGPVDDEVVEKTIPFLPLVVADMVRFQRLVGCRPSELCSIKPSMIDRTSSDVWEIKLDQHKNAWRGKSRTVYVGPNAQKILMPYLLRGADDYCFSPKESESKRRKKAHDERETPLNCGTVPGSRRKQRRKGDLPPKVGVQPGRKYDRTSYARAIKRACESAFPIPDDIPSSEKVAWITKHMWSPNRLRHTFGTRVRRVFGLEETQLLLGHSSAATSEIYAETDKEKARVAARRIG